VFGYICSLSASVQPWERVGQLGFYAGYSLIQAICGWFILKRRWWAWIVGTILSLNILLWIINGIYGAKRRDDFAYYTRRGTMPSQNTPSAEAAAASEPPLPLLPPAFVFACPHCAQPITATRDKIGSSGGCPRCQKSLTVPQPTA
jgi:hypothetical protein